MEKRDFVIEYEVKNRELDFLCLVAAYLRKKGYSVAFVNSWDSLYRRPTAYDAQVAVISACYNDGTYDFFAGFVASYKKVVNMQWEQVLSNRFYKEHAKEFHDYCGIGLNTRHVCWGEKEKQWMMENYNIQEEYMNVVGYLPLDFYRADMVEKAADRETLFAKYGLDSSKKTLLFVSSFSSVNLPDTEEVGSETFFEMKRKCDIESQRVILQWFEQVVKEMDDVQIIYRYHPAEKSNEAIKELAAKYSNFFVLAEEPIRYWIKACDKIYNWCSTSMIEMWCSRKDTYILRPVDIPNDIDMPVFRNAKAIDNYYDFKESVMENEMREFPVAKDTLLEWYDISDVPTYKRIGDWLIDTYHDTTYSSRKSNNNVHKGVVQKALKDKLKRNKLFKQSLAFAKSIVGPRLKGRITTLQNNMTEQEKFFKAKVDENGYINAKRILNCASEEEIDKKIEAYMQMIE